MGNANKTLPLVHGGPAVSGSGSGYGNCGSGCVKKLRKSWNGNPAPVNAALVNPQPDGQKGLKRFAFSP
ncbi:jg3247 [Pararge aegeria aegeria]|uniref:Jg3247 protein n=1 Tax=Pararge aegeria aegeria TaxID=348720 RepID=A0A8S4RS04_9NEOP|nr:jg3247 [Pararge aegeria aegeria]